MTCVPQARHGCVMKTAAKAVALRLIDDEQGPDIPRLVFDTGEALNTCSVLQNPEDGLLRVPGDLLVRDKARVGELVLRCAMAA